MEYRECLAVNRTVSASTQNQALNAIVFLFENALKKEPSGYLIKDNFECPILNSQFPVDLIAWILVIGHWILDIAVKEKELQQVSMGSVYGVYTFHSCNLLM